MAKQKVPSLDDLENDAYFILRDYCVALQQAYVRHPDETLVSRIQKANAAAAQFGIDVNAPIEEIPDTTDAVSTE